MTCIAAVRSRNRVWIGGDSASSDDAACEQMTSPKVWEIAPGVVAGWSGSGWEWYTAARWRLEIARPLRGNVEGWLATELVDAMRRAFTAAGLGELDLGEDVTPWSLIVGVGGKSGGLFQVNYPAAVTRCRNAYTATGSGAPLALGALYATSATPPETRLRWALEAAALHSPGGVQPPFRVIHT